MRSPLPSRPRVAALALIGAALAACTDFDIQWLVNDFRVLAVSAIDGPEEFVDAVVLFDPELLERLSELEDAEDLAELGLTLDDLEDQATFLVVDSTVDYVIQPLVVDPAHPNGPFRLRARACVFNETYRCDFDDDSELVERAGFTTGTIDGDPNVVVDIRPSIEAFRPDDLTFFFTPTIPFLNEAVTRDPFKGFGGLYLLIDIDIEGPSGIIRVAKTVSAQPAGLEDLFDLDEELRPNRNPRLCGVRVTYPNNDSLRPERVGDDDEIMREVWRQKNNVSLCDDFELTDEYITSDDPLPVIAGTEVLLRPLPPLDRDGQLRAEEERYYTLSLDSDQGPTMVRQIERLEIDLYVTAGKLDDDRAFTRSVFGAQVSPEFTWTLPKTIGPATIWLVLRDNRGGVSWMERTVDVVRAPPPEPEDEQ